MAVTTRSVTIDSRAVPLIEAAVKLREQHTPDPEDPSDIGWRQDAEGKSLGYGTINPACRTCDHPGEYAVAWPCPTFTLLNDALTPLGLSISWPK